MRGHAVIFQGNLNFVTFLGPKVAFWSQKSTHFVKFQSFTFFASPSLGNLNEKSNSHLSIKVKFWSQNLLFGPKTPGCSWLSKRISNEILRFLGKIRIYPLFMKPCISVNFDTENPKMISCFSSSKVDV